MTQTIFGGHSITTLKNLRHLVSKFPSHSGSVTVVSPSRINAQWLQWQSKLPSVKPFYAVKCNPEPALLQSLIFRGAHFDCASIREVHDVRQHLPSSNYSGSMILYAHPMKSERDIRTIDTLGIKTTVVDSVEECTKLEACGWKGDAYLRVAVGDKGSKMPFSVKFGASQAEVDLIARLSKINLSGVSFHVGSGCQDPTQYTKAIEYVSTTVFNILRKHGHSPKVIDIGGGFSANPVEFGLTASAINMGLKSISKGSNICKVIAEPGRYFAQPSQDLFVKVIAKKRGQNGVGWRYVIDESLYGHFSCIPFDHQTPAWFRVPDSNDIKRDKSEAILFGRTCDSLDVIAKGVMENLEVGDWLYFPLMGAYTSATASEFNGFPKPHIEKDEANLLPDASMVWDSVNRFHVENPLTYSNALPPII